MASNTSQSQTHSIVLRAMVAEYRTWSLLVACWPHSAVRAVSLATLPQDATIVQVLMHMRCRTYHSRAEAAAIATDNGVPGS